MPENTALYGDSARVRSDSKHLVQVRCSLGNMFGLKNIKITGGAMSANEEAAAINKNSHWICRFSYFPQRCSWVSSGIH